MHGIILANVARMTRDGWVLLPPTMSRKQTIEPGHKLAFEYNNMAHDANGYRSLAELS